MASEHSGEPEESHAAKPFHSDRALIPLVNADGHATQRSARHRGVKRVQPLAILGANPNGRRPVRDQESALVVDLPRTDYRHATLSGGMNPRVEAAVCGTSQD